MACTLAWGIKAGILPYGYEIGKHDTIVLSTESADKNSFDEAAVKYQAAHPDEQMRQEYEFYAEIIRNSLNV